MKSVEELLTLQWNGDQKMVAYLLKGATYLNMGSYYLDVGGRPTISRTIYYADTDYATGEMADDPGTSYNVFKNHNMRLHSNQRWIEELEEGRVEVVITQQYHQDKTGGCLKGWTTKRSYELQANDVVATPEERAKILQTLKEQDRLYEKRLETYYKRYGHKVRTSSYWADR